ACVGAGSSDDGGEAGEESGGKTDTCTVLRNVRGDTRRQQQHTRAAGGAREEREERESTGRATHAARVADEVHVDPPPQVHAGVGHGPEYTMGRPGASTHARHVTPGPVSGPTPDAVSPAGRAVAGRTCHGAMRLMAHGAHGGCLPRHTLRTTPSRLPPPTPSPLPCSPVPRAPSRPPRTGPPVAPRSGPCRGVRRDAPAARCARPLLDTPRRPAVRPGAATPRSEER